MTQAVSTCWIQAKSEISPQILGSAQFSALAQPCILILSAGPAGNHTGATGPRGLPGWPGADGKRGPAGPQGDKGPPGEGASEGNCYRHIFVQPLNVSFYAFKPSFFLTTDPVFCFCDFHSFSGCSGCAAAQRCKYLLSGFTVDLHLQESLFTASRCVTQSLLRHPDVRHILTSLTSV